MRVCLCVCVCVCVHACVPGTCRCWRRGRRKHRRCTSAPSTHAGTGVLKARGATIIRVGQIRMWQIQATVSSIQMTTYAGRACRINTAEDTDLFLHPNHHRFADHAQVPDEKLAQMQEMGLTMKEAVRALRFSGGSIEAGLDFLSKQREQAQVCVFVCCKGGWGRVCGD